jgi:hypothetical protein
MATHDDKCKKCYGAKGFPAYARWDGGVCYRCEGTGYEPPKGEHNRGRPFPGRGRGAKAPHPSAAEAKAIADRELAVAGKEFDFADESFSDLPYIKNAATRKLEEERVAATFFLAGIAIGRSIVDFARFQRALARGRQRVIAGYEKNFEQGLKSGIKEQSERYDGIVWEGR